MPAVFITPLSREEAFVMHRRRAIGLTEESRCSQRLTAAGLCRIYTGLPPLFGLRNGDLCDGSLFNCSFSMAAAAARVKACVVNF
jgi:hypothetical protein